MKALISCNRMNKLNGLAHKPVIQKQHIALEFIAIVWYLGTIVELINVQRVYR